MPEHLKLQYEKSKYDVKWLNMKYIHVRNGYLYQSLKSSIISTVAQASIRQLHKRRFDGCASDELTVAQTSNRWLHKGQFDDCTSEAGISVVSAVILVILKKSIKIFRCPFSATVTTKPINNYVPWVPNGSSVEVCCLYCNKVCKWEAGLKHHTNRCKEID